ncbi:hypothetical protein RFI_34517, partial [Reticulomyxa filosa]
KKTYIFVFLFIYLFFTSHQKENKKMVEVFTTGKRKFKLDLICRHSNSYKYFFFVLKNIVNKLWFVCVYTGTPRRIYFLNGFWKKKIKINKLGGVGEGQKNAVIKKKNNNNKNDEMNNGKKKKIIKKKKI